MDVKKPRISDVDGRLRIGVFSTVRELYSTVFTDVKRLLRDRRTTLPTRSRAPSQIGQLRPLAGAPAQTFDRRLRPLNSRSIGDYASCIVGHAGLNELQKFSSGRLNLRRPIEKMA